MMSHVDAIMTLLQKIYALLAVLLFVVAAVGTSWMGVYVVDNCGASVSESCIGLKTTFGLFILCLIASCAYVGRIAWRICRKQGQVPTHVSQSTPLLGHNPYSEDERIYNV